MNLIKILFVTALIFGLSITVNSQTKDFFDLGKLKSYLNVIHQKKGFSGEILIANGKHILFQETVGLASCENNLELKKGAKYRIALNTALATFRKNKVALEFQESIPKDYHSNDTEVSSENEERMFEAIRMLTKAERAIIALHLEDYSHKEIAETVRITENYVGVKISRIKEKLKKILTY